MTWCQTLRVRGGAVCALSLLAACGGGVSKGNGMQEMPPDAQTAAGSSSGSSSSSGGPQGALDASPDSDAQDAATGLASFAFMVNGVVQTPLSCPAENWEYPPPAAQMAKGGGDSVCNSGVAPCPGLRALLINTGQYAVAYTAQTGWEQGGAGEPPGVPFGNKDELSGVLNPGDQVDITSVYVGGITAVLGSSHPFVVPDATKYVADGATIPWPAGVAGSDGASEMYVAEIEIVDACQTPAVVW